MPTPSAWRSWAICGRKLARTERSEVLGNSSGERETHRVSVTNGEAVSVATREIAVAVCDAGSNPLLTQLRRADRLRFGPVFFKGLADIGSEIGVFHVDDAEGFLAAEWVWDLDTDLDTVE